MPAGPVRFIGAVTDSRDQTYGPGFSGLHRSLDTIRSPGLYSCNAPHCLLIFLRGRGQGLSAASPYESPNGCLSHFGTKSESVSTVWMIRDPRMQNPRGFTLARHGGMARNFHAAGRQPCLPGRNRARGRALLTRAAVVSLHHIGSAANSRVPAPVTPPGGRIWVDRPQPEAFFDPVSDPPPHTSAAPVDRAIAERTGLSSSFER
jgi:hypothetical protein